MNGTKLLVDTNIALYYLGGDRVLSALLDQREVFVSVISEMEMLGYPGISDQEITNIKAFLSDCQIVSLSNEVKEQAIVLRKSYNLKLPDAIIAASSLVHHLPLISADLIFKRIEELNFVYYAL